MRVSQYQFLRPATHHAIQIQKMHGINHLILQKRTHCDDMTDTATADQHVADFHTRIGAVIADIASDPHPFAKVEAFFIKAVFVHVLMSPREMNTVCGSPILNTLKTFSVWASDATKS